MRRLVVQDSCKDHGLFGKHPWYGNYNDPRAWCPGGSENPLDPEQALLFQPGPDRMGETIVYLDVQDILDALEMIS